MLEQIKNKMLELGASGASITTVDKIVFDPEFRKACEVNACGRYGKSWMCPPHVGEINQLIAKAKTFKNAVVYQYIGELEDSYDFEGMMDAGAEMNKITRNIQEELYKQFPDALYLGAGGCGICPKCAILDQKPCRFPEKAIPSLESFGIGVSQLASACGLKYINGADTVTYFGAVLTK